MGSVSTIHGNLNCIINDTTCQKGLELEIKHHNQIITKFLKWIVKNILLNYKL